MKRDRQQLNVDVPNKTHARVQINPNRWDFRKRDEIRYCYPVDNRICRKAYTPL
jgi:hypothetical protein